MRELVDLGERLVKRSRYTETEVDRQTALRAVCESARPPDGVAFGVYRKERLTAGIVMCVSNYFWTHPLRGARFGTDLFFASEHAGDGLRVLRAAVDWAFEQPRVVECSFGVSSGIGEQALLDKLYGKIGATRYGSIYTVRAP
jgi:hypothetical protein